MKVKLLLIGTLVLLLAACTPLSAAPTSSPEMVLTDGLGRQVTFEGPAQRIVSLAPSITEILFSIGAGGQVVGRDEFSDYPPEVKDVASVGGSMGDYTLEAIAALEPDLILAAEINTPEQVKSMQDLGLRVYYLKNPVTLEGMFDQLILVGSMVGREDEAAALKEDLVDRVQVARELAANAPEKPLVFYELDGSDPAKPWTAGQNTFIDTLITEAGGINIGGVLDGAYAQISQEEILLQNPDIILLGDSAYGVTPEQVSARPGWDSIKAVKLAHVYPFDDNLVSRPAPRLVDGLEQLVLLLHPEVELQQ